MRNLLVALFVLLGIQNWSCGILQAIAVNSTAGILDHGLEAIYEESDLGLAEQAIASDIKLLEALYKTGGEEDDHLRLLLTQAYTGYALGFVEDSDPERAKIFYRRALKYGLKSLKKNPRFTAGLEGDMNAFREGVESLSIEDVPIIFWTANAWANLINLGFADPEIMADVPKTSALMDFVLRRDERFYYGSAHLYFGTILATTPKVLGGNPDGAREHFEKCLAIGERKMLLPFVYYAKSYAVQVQDEALFESLLKTVEETSIDVLPEQRLVNAIAKRKARALLERKSELF